jgi:hypothetical protein
VYDKCVHGTRYTVKQVLYRGINNLGKGLRFLYKKKGYKDERNGWKKRKNVIIERKGRGWDLGPWLTSKMCTFTTVVVDV